LCITLSGNYLKIGSKATSKQQSRICNSETGVCHFSLTDLISLIKFLNCFKGISYIIRGAQNDFLKCNFRFIACKFGDLKIRFSTASMKNRLRDSSSQCSE